MNKTQAYILDSDVLIRAEREYYSFVFCPGFWKILRVGESRSMIRTIDRVRAELTRSSKEDDRVAGRREDPLKDWVQEMPDSFYLSSDVDGVIEQQRKVAAWAVGHPRATQAEVERFLSGADPWLVSCCIAYGTKLVTQEVSNPESKKIKLPDVCREFDVPCINTFELLSQLSHELIAKPRASRTLEDSF